MDLNILNISRAETYLNSILDEQVSSNTFPSDLPTTIDASWNDMVVFSISSRLTDYGAYGLGTAMIYLYAKPMTNGRKNVAVMSQMEQKLNKVIDSAHDDHYKISRRGSYEDYDASRNLHCNIIELNLLII